LSSSSDFAGKTTEHIRAQESTPEVYLRIHKNFRQVFSHLVDDSVRRFFPVNIKDKKKSKSLSTSQNKTKS
jgi:hypothetical protein